MRRLYEFISFAALIAAIWLPEHRGEALGTAGFAFCFFLGHIIASPAEGEAVEESLIPSPPRDGEVIYRSKGEGE